MDFLNFIADVFYVYIPVAMLIFIVYAVIMVVSAPYIDDLKRKLRNN